VRNYVLTKAIVYHAHGDDGFGATIDEDFSFLAESLSDLQGIIDDTNSTLEAAFPAFSFTYEYRPFMDLYVCLDKENIVKILQLQNVSSIAGSLYGVAAGIQAATPPFDFKVQTTSPRYTGWTNLQGERHNPPPSDRKGVKFNFGGAANLLANFLKLPEVIASLKKQGRLRDAGIVQFAYDEVLRGKMSITEAFAYIDKNI